MFVTQDQRCVWLYLGPYAQELSDLGSPGGDRAAFDLVGPSGFCGLEEPLGQAARRDPVPPREGVAISGGGSWPVLDGARFDDEDEEDAYDSEDEEEESDDDHDDEEEFEDEEDELEDEEEEEEEEEEKEG